MSMNWTVPVSAPDKPGETWLRHVASAVVGSWSACRRWRAEQLAIEQLSAMSDRELQDIGLIRSEIGIAVHIGPQVDDTPRVKWRGAGNSIR